MEDTTTKWQETSQGKKYPTLVEEHGVDQGRDSFLWFLGRNSFLWFLCRDSFLFYFPFVEEQFLDQT